jgi:hypothetical protein
VALKWDQRPRGSVSLFHQKATSRRNELVAESSSLSTHTRARISPRLGRRNREDGLAVRPNGVLATKKDVERFFGRFGGYEGVGVHRCGRRDLPDHRATLEIGGRE